MALLGAMTNPNMELLLAVAIAAWWWLGGEQRKVVGIEAETDVRPRELLVVAVGNVAWALPLASAQASWCCLWRWLYVS